MLMGDGDGRVNGCCLSWRRGAGMGPARAGGLQQMAPPPANLLARLAPTLQALQIRRANRNRERADARKCVSCFSCTLAPADMCRARFAPARLLLGMELALPLDPRLRPPAARSHPLQATGPMISYRASNVCGRRYLQVRKEPGCSDVRSPSPAVCSASHHQGHQRPASAPCLSDSM